jgi:hypothetical protein
MTLAMNVPYMLKRVDRDLTVYNSIQFVEQHDYDKLE